MAFGPVNVPVSGDLTVEEILKYVDEQVASSGGKLKVFPFNKVAETEGQTVFHIDMVTFDAANDFVLVQSGITSLFYGEDYTIEGENVVLTEGVPMGRKVGIYVLKNVESTDTEEMISGVNIEPGSIPMDRMEESVASALTELMENGAGGKLAKVDEHYVATEGQTEFPIAYETFDHLNDLVFVTSGRTSLSEGLDYTVESQKVVLTEGVPAGRTVVIRILKNANTDAQDATMSGVYIEKGSMPLDRLAEGVATEAFVEQQIASIPAPEVNVTADMPVHISLGENGGLVITVTYDDGTEG